VANQGLGGPKAGMSLRRMFFSPQTAISFLLVVALVLLLLFGFDIAWGETWHTIKESNPWWFLVAIVVHYMTFIFRGARWRVLLINATRNDEVPPLPLPVLYSGKVILMSWFANSVTFFRMGDAFRAFVFANDTKTSFPRSVGTVLADRVIDIVVVIFLMSVALVLLLAGSEVHPPVALLLLAGGFLLAVMAALAAMTLGRRWITPRLPQRAADIYHHFHSGTMGSFARLPTVFLLGVASWLCEFGRLFFVLQAVGTPVTLGLILFVPMANGVFSSIPLTPGGLGIVETGISGLLQLELSVEVAVAVALMDRSISYLSIIVTGGALFFARQVSAARRATMESG
jgi:uncharacterized protein (TIRG00374 family)